MLSDGELLQRYLDDHAEAAFTELVQRHINVVYLAALRRVGGNAHSADDVTQRVFSSLAQKAKSLAGRPNLTGWLYTSTRFAAIDVVRAEQRRRVYEEKAHLMMNENFSQPSAGRSDLDPVLDEVMDRLPERDREAVLLHFFEGHSFAEVGSILSMSADAARMRVNRALERLRAGLAQRGITSTATALAGVLSTQSAIAAPPSLAIAVAGHAINAAAAAGAGTSLLARLIGGARTVPLVPVVGAAVVLALIGGGVHSFRTRDTNETILLAPTVSQKGERVAEVVALPDTKGPDPTLAPSPAPASLPATRSLPALGFAALTPAQKTILARLWYLHETTHPAPGKQIGLKPNPAGPQFDKLEAGYEQLIANGWVKAGPNSGAFFLTPSGIDFCTVNRAEIEASPAFRNAPAMIRS